MNIYFEKQRGGLCRLHSLNGFFGMKKINDNEFNNYKKEYDLYMKKKFNIPDKQSCSDYDYINSDQNTIISYILKYHYKVYTRYFAINELHNNKFNNSLNLSSIINQITIDKIINKFIFVFNSNHIWGIKYKDNKWYSVDSLSGVREIKIKQLSNTKNLGYIIPTNMKVEFDRNTTLIKEILYNEAKINTDSDEKEIISNVSEYLIKLNKSLLFLGELEIPLTIIIEILEINLIYFDKTDIFNNKNINLIKEIVFNFNEFLSIVSQGNYSNIDLLLLYIPAIIHKLFLIL